MMLNIAHAFLKCMLFVLYRIHIVGKENIPDGAAVICANHSGYFDPLFVIGLMKIKQFPYILGKKELFNTKIKARFFRWVHVISVDRGAADIRAIKRSLELLRAGKRLLIFPEGTRVTEPNAVQNKTGAVMLAIKVNVPIVPMYITQGRKTIFRRIDLIIGEPYRIDLKGEKPTPDIYAREADAVMKRVYGLKPS